VLLGISRALQDHGPSLPVVGRQGFLYPLQEGRKVLYVLCRQQSSSANVRHPISHTINKKGNKLLQLQPISVHNFYCFYFVLLSSILMCEKLTLLHLMQYEEHFLSCALQVSLALVRIQRIGPIHFLHSFVISLNLNFQTPVECVVL